MSGVDDETNSVYQVRMNEFCTTYMKNEQQQQQQQVSVVVDRPKCSVSPINFSTMTDSDTSSSSAAASSSLLSPLVGPKLLHLSQLEPPPSYSSPFHPPTIGKPINKHLLAIAKDQPQQQHPMQFQSSTPNTKPMMVSNRVNFHSIAELSTSSAKSSSSALSESSFHDSGYVSSSSASLASTSSSTPYSLSSSSSLPQSSMSFNESLKSLSESMSANKENFRDDDDSTAAKTKRKPRTSINKQQKEILEYAYKMKPYPDSNEVEYLCQLLGFEENVIRIWFQNKRARNKHSNRSDRNDN